MRPSVSAVLLAAGASRRMGRPKQLLPVGGKPAVRLCAENILAAGISDIVVVLGPNSGDVEAALAGLPVKIAWDQAPESGPDDPVRPALGLIDPAATGVLVCTADHPLVSPETLTDLAQEHAAGIDKILVLVHRGRHGQPALFPRDILLELAGGGTVGDLRDRHAERIRMLCVDDPGVVLDLDTPEDYERMLRMTGIPS